MEVRVPHGWRVGWFDKTSLNLGVLFGEVLVTVCKLFWQFPWGHTLFFVFAKACLGLFVFFCLLFSMLFSLQWWCMVLVKNLSYTEWGKIEKIVSKMPTGSSCGSIFWKIFQQRKNSPWLDILVIFWCSFFLPFIALKAAFPSFLPLVRLNVYDRSNRQGSVNVNNWFNALWLWRLNRLILFIYCILSVHVLVLTEMVHN